LQLINQIKDMLVYNL